MVPFDKKKFCQIDVKIVVQPNDPPESSVICWSHLTLLVLPHFYSWTKGQLISGQYQTKLKIHTNKMMLLYESWAKITEGF